MLSRFLLLFLMAGCATTPLALAEKSNPTVIDNDTEMLIVKIPQDWQKRVERTVGTLQVAEYYPPDSREDWAQKLSIEALSSEDLADPIDFVLDLAAQQNKVCTNFTDNGVFSGFENGFATTVHMMQCGQNKNTGRDVVTVIKVIRANESLYTITRVWRLAPPAPPLAADTINIDQDEVAAWSQTLRSVIVCDRELAAHPCPDSGSDEQTAVQP